MTVTLAAPTARFSLVVVATLLASLLPATAAAGLRTYMSSAISNTPIQVSFDDLRAVAP